MSKKCKKRKENNDHDSEQMILACLWDGPLTISEMNEQFTGVLRRFGVFEHQLSHWLKDEEDMDEHLNKQLPVLIKRGLIENIKDRYELTKSGRYEAEKAIEEINKFSNVLKRAARPETVSIVSLISYIVLGFIKLPAAILSGSVGLLNDAIDTLLDVFSRILVTTGIQRNTQRLSNSVMVGTMLITGFYAFYRAMQQFFFPSDLKYTVFAYVAVILSIIISILLALYQRFIGVKSGNIALITLSVDSRNHIIIAASVIFGLIASYFGFHYIDSIIGLVVAGIILKSAVEMTWELFQQEEEYSPDFERYNMFLSDKVRDWQDKHYHLWLLYLIDAERLNTQQKLEEHCNKSLDFSGNILLREMGLMKEINVQEQLQNSIDNLLEKGWIDTSDGFSVSDKGKEQLKSWVT